MRFLSSIFFILGLASVHAYAFETDQFTLPPEPLKDVGTELNQLVLTAVNQAIAEANTKQDFSETDLADRVHHHLCSNITLCEPEAWAAQTTNFKPALWESIHKGVFAPIPFAFLFDSPTINVFGVYLGTDKIGHFFAQGYGYYETFMKAIGNGLSEEAAIRKTVQEGINEERSYFGYWPAGTYSNADLAADYAGFKFYLNLTRTVRMGEVWMVPAIVEKENNSLKLSGDVNAETLLNAFMDERFNEALNPSMHIFSRAKLRKAVRARCARWIQEFQMSRESVEAKIKELSTWHGEDYGYHLDPSYAITLATECYSNP